MDTGSAKQQVVESIKSNSNILVTVNDSPSVDELSAALGLTILLNNIEKRATAVVSGELPPAITFLDPEKTFESTVDSLRDFIVALDKEKADHLRYKVDGDVVKIFITPYRTSLTEADLEFSQGDYNVELVLAIGVRSQDHLDTALAAHGKIFHDATVATLSLGEVPSSLGSVDWRDAAASSYCEMLLSLSEALKDDKPVLDEQIATAFLTGIVSATDRFSNARTSSRVMTMAAQLMAAGANQQLIAAKLEEAHDIGPNAVNKVAEAPIVTPKKEQDESSLTITENRSKRNRSSKSRDRKPGDKQADKPAGEAAAAAASSAADAAADAEAKLEKQIEATLPAAPTSIADELAQELKEAELPQPAATLTPAMPPMVEPLPTLPDNAVPPVSGPAPATLDTGMPGFEALEAPVPPAPEPLDQPKVGEARSYIAPSQDTPTDDNQATIDPFAGPPLSPPASSSTTPSTVIQPLTMTELPAPEHVTTPLEQDVFNHLDQASPAVTPVAGELLSPPPLPPLPDFGTLPPPPPPPVFDQPGAMPPALPPLPSPGVAADPFGVPSVAPPPPNEPTPPGQFRIPGQ